MISPTLFSSGDSKGTYEWATPDTLFRELTQGLHVDLDVAASPTNYKCEKWLGPAEFIYPQYLSLCRWEKLEEGDPLKVPRGTAQRFLENMGCCSLQKPWHQLGTRAWCNCPYGSLIDAFTRKGVEEIVLGLKSVTFLLPVRTDTKWFHRDIVPALKRVESRYCHPAPAAGALLKFIKGRVKFEFEGEALDPAPFPSMVVHMYRLGASK